MLRDISRDQRHDHPLACLHSLVWLYVLVGYEGDSSGRHVRDHPYPPLSHIGILETIVRCGFDLSMIGDVWMVVVGIQQMRMSAHVFWSCENSEGGRYQTIGCLVVFVVHLSYFSVTIRDLLH